jgi:hypothetical protein
MKNHPNAVAPDVRPFDLGWGLLLPIVFMGNIVVATLAWFIVWMVTR